MLSLKKFSQILIALSVMLGLVAAAFQPALAATEMASVCTQWHTVARGEYLSMIARMYNTDWRTLAEINNLTDPSRIYAGQKLCVATGSSGSSSQGSTPSTSSGVRVYALSVEEDQFVTLQGKKLAAYSRYTIYLSKYGTYPIGATFLGSVVTDKYGAFSETFRMPSKLVDVQKIAINISNGRGDATSNWFINATADGNTGGEGAPALGLGFVSVREDEWVKIKTSNLPANVTFDVLMGKSGTKGVNGVKVGTLRDDEGGSVRATFNIPSQLQGRSRIDLRIENKALGIYSYLSFEN